MNPQSAQEELEPDAQALLGRIIDGPPGPALHEQIQSARRLSPAERQRLRQHLLLDEILSQSLAPERSADAFLAGLIQRHRCEQDGEAFTNRVMERIEARGTARLRKTGWFLLEIAGLSAAALLLLGTFLAMGELVSMPHLHSSPRVSHVPRPIDLNATLAATTRELE